MDEDKPPSTAQRLRMVGLQLVGASAIVWTLTALVALLFHRVGHTCVRHGVSLASLCVAVGAIIVGSLTVHGAGSIYPELVVRRWRYRFAPPPEDWEPDRRSRTHDPTKAELAGGLSYALVAWFAAAELFVFSWFFSPRC